MLTAVAALLLSSMASTIPYVSIIIFMIILGGGLGISMPTVNSNVQNAAPVEQLAAATGAMQFFRSIGSTVGSAIFGTIMASAMAKGFMSLDLSAVPESVRSALRDPQVITNTAVLNQVTSQVPADNASAVATAVAGAKNVLLGGIHNVFFFCAIIAVVGIVLSVFFKGAPMRIVHMDGRLEDDGNATPPETPAEIED
jgi:fucose permease